MGTHPKLTTTYELVYFSGLLSKCGFLIDVMKGARTIYPSLPSLYLLTKNLSSYYIIKNIL